VAGPGNDLPFIDRLVIEVAADRSATWAALIEVLTRSLESRGSRLGSRLLESSVLEAGGPRPLAPGSTLPGFRVVSVDPSRELVLDGSHRFAHHEMAFEVGEIDPDRSELAVVTRAEFPGPVGTAYRALVIGSRGHVLVTRRLLNSVRREAEGRGST
jgi:hypothetical protein